MYKILLVGDSEIALDRAKACLEKRNLQVATGSRVQALELADTLQPDLILLDFETPENNSEELRRLLSSNPRTANSRVLALNIDLENRQKQCEVLVKAVAGVLRITPRRHVRVPCRFTVGISERGSVYVGLAENISMGGMLLTAEEFFRTETLLRLRFELPESRKQVKTLSRVVRSGSAGDRGYALGLEFLDMDYASRQVLADYFNEDPAPRNP